MSDGQKYKKAFDHVKPGVDFEKKTLLLLIQEQRKKETHIMNRKKMVAVFGGIAACLLLAVGIFSMNNWHGAAPEQSTEPPAVAAKGIVNIDGIIEEVAPDGQSFRVGDLWVTVDGNTLYGIPGPNALPMEEQLVSDDFQVGNAVSGYTEDNLSGGSVRAVRIYNNFPAEPAD